MRFFNFNFIFIIVILHGCGNPSSNSKLEYDRIRSIVSGEIDSLDWAEKARFKGKGSHTLKNITCNRPFRIRYAYKDIGNSSLIIYIRENKATSQEPLLISTESETNTVYVNRKIIGADLKIVTQGLWSLVFEELGGDYTTSASSVCIDSLKVGMIQDSLLTERATFLARRDTVLCYDDIRDDVKEWVRISARKGWGDYETDWFTLPASKVRIRTAVYPADGSSVTTNMSLEGKREQDSWTIQSGWIFTRDWDAAQKEFNVPAGSYFFSVSCDGIWQYDISAYY